MTLTEGFVRDNIVIDFAGEILYGSEQANLTYPRRFATVELPLSATEGLIQIADRIRKEAGFRPIRPMDEYTGETCDNAAWYDFYVSGPITNCELVNLGDMLQNGTVITDTLIEKPHSFSTACNIATQIIAQVASNTYGGQTISLAHRKAVHRMGRRQVR